MALTNITQFYKNILGRTPDPGGLRHYTSQAKSGRSLSDIRNEIYSSPEAIGYRTAQQQKQTTAAVTAATTATQAAVDKQISGLKSSFQQSLNTQQQQFAQAQREQQERMEQMQQQYAQAQARLAAPEQSAQVLGVGGPLSIRRAGASRRFSRPELQIKSVNI